MSRLGLGVLGIGTIARHLYVPGIVETAARSDVIHLAAVASRSVEARGWVSSAFSGVPTHSSMEQLFADPAVEMVINLTPSPVHAETTLAAVRAGKHVFSEKPLAASVAQATAIIDAAYDAGVVVACAPVIGLHPDVQQAREWVRNGAIGTVSMVRARASHPGPAWDPDFATDPTWFYQPGAGPVLDLAVYPIHVLCLMLGPVRRVSALAATSHPKRTVRSGPAKGAVIAVTTPDNVPMILDFGDDRLATIDASWNALSARGPRMEVYGDRGVLNLYSRPDEPPYELFLEDQSTGVRGWLEIEPSYRGSLMPALEGLPRPKWSFVDGIVHVAACIRAGITPVPSAELGRHILEVCLAALQSAEDGRVIEVHSTFSVDEEAW